MTHVTLPHALEHWPKIAARVASKHIALLLDYDGTLTRIVPHPQDALLSESVRDLLRCLADHCPVAIITGRDRANAAQLVGLEGLYYAGSHGFDIRAPKGTHYEPPEAVALLPMLHLAKQDLSAALEGFAGAVVERKRFSVAVHFRHVAPDNVSGVQATAITVAQRFPQLRVQGGSKKTIELQPDIDWHKGRAVEWLLRSFASADDASPRLPIYIGDDQTDEDGFAAIRSNGIGIWVGEPTGSTAAGYRLRDPDDVQKFLSRLFLESG